MENKQTLYIVMVFQSWEESMELRGNPVTPFVEEGSTGFLPVFADPEKAREEYPEHQIFAVSFAKKTPRRSKGV